MHPPLISKKTLIGFCLGTLITAGTAFSADLPSVAPAYTQAAPVIDGKLDDAAWSKASWVELKHYTKGTPVSEKTQAYLLYDKTNLYIGFKCQESQMDKTLSDVTIENGPVFLDDCVEVMIGPSEVVMPGKYYHFVSNISGIKYSYDGINPDTKPAFEVKTAKAKGSWTVEMAIPYTSLIRKDNNDSFWRINLFREQQPKKELSAWNATDGGFHSPYQFGKLTGILLDGKFIGLKKFIEPETNKVSLKSPTIDLAKAVDPTNENIVIIPKPVKMTLLDNDFALTAKTRIVINDKASKGNKQAAAEINEELKEYYGMELPIVEASSIKNMDFSGCIVLGEPDNNPTVKKLLGEMNLEVTKETPGPEGYVLKADDKTILIAGSDDAGTYYGVQSLKQLFKKSDKGIVSAKGVQIWDKPAFKIRSVHVLIDMDSDTVHAKMISKLFARFKMNEIVMEAEQGVKWESRPEVVTKYALDKDKVRELVKYAKKHYMRVTPLIQSLGHGEWMFRNGSNLDFCEDSEHPYAYCVLNPKSYDFIFALMDETIDIFDHPEYIHIGHDEHDMFGKFPNHPECKLVGNSNLYFMDTMKIYNFLKARGVKTMLWGDVFPKPDFKSKLAGLPRDVMVVDWHYGPELAQPTVDWYQENGFQVVGGTWFDPRNISRFSEYGEKKHILGMMQTTWAGYDQNSSIVTREPHQVTAYITGADYFWNPDNRNINAMGYDPAKVLKSLWFSGSVEQKKASKGFAVNLDAYANMRLEDNGTQGFLGRGKGLDFSPFFKDVAKSTLVHLNDDVNYQIAKIQGVPAGVVLAGKGITGGFPSLIKGIKVNQFADTLYFLNSTLYAAKFNDPVGQYIVTYQDNSKVVIDLNYRKNISGWQDVETYYMGNLSWQGVGIEDEGVFIRSMAWVNPYPAKKIKTIDFLVGTEKTSPVLLAITGTTPVK